MGSGSSVPDGEQQDSGALSGRSHPVHKEELQIFSGLAKAKLSSVDIRVREELDDGQWSWVSEETASIWSSSEDMKLFADCVAEWPILGVLTPPCPLDRLPQEHRSNAFVPRKAIKFAWAHSSVIAFKSGNQEVLDRLMSSKNAEMQFFLRGGFVFCDADAAICGTSVLTPTDEGSGLQFARPQRWDPKWTLQFASRFKKVTLKALYDIGARHYCWIGPGEPGVADLKGITMNHGGFAYLFHDDLLASDPSDCWRALTAVLPTRRDGRTTTQWFYVSDVWSQYKSSLRTPYATLAKYLKEERKQGRLPEDRFISLMRALSDLASTKKHTVHLADYIKNARADQSDTQHALIANWMPHFEIALASETVVVRTKSEGLRAIGTTESITELRTHLPTLEDLDIDTFATPHDDIVEMMMLAFYVPWDLLSGFPIVQATLARWINAIAAKYKTVPYHRWAHAWDTFQMVYLELTEGGAADRFFESLDILALLTAAIAHDVGHPGVTNAFLSRTAAEIAITYNDASVLENMHASILFQTLRENDDLNFLQDLQQSVYADFRKKAIGAVLATDMSHHFTMVEVLHHRAKIQQESDASGTHGAGAEMERDTQFLLNLMLHFADISCCVRPAKVFLDRTLVIEEEFFLQGDQERELGLPISPMMDRNGDPLLKSQGGFVNFVVAPLLSGVQLLIPGLAEEITSNLKKTKKAVEDAVSKLVQVKEAATDTAKKAS